MTDSSEGSQMEQPSESCLGPASIYLENSEAEAIYTCQSQNAWHLLLPKILWCPASAGVNLVCWQWVYHLAPWSFFHLSTFLWCLVPVFLGTGDVDYLYGEFLSFQTSRSLVHDCSGTLVIEVYTRNWRLLFSDSEFDIKAQERSL